MMISRTFLVLITFVIANAAFDNKKVTEDVNRIENRLATIEDVIAGERLQRREDVRLILKNLAELQNAVQENYGNKQDFKVRSNKKNSFYETQAMIIREQIARAFTKEKEMNVRLRREIQSKLRDFYTGLSNAIATKADLSNVAHGINTITKQTSQQILNLLNSIERDQDGIQKISGQIGTIHKQITANRDFCWNSEEKMDKFIRLVRTTLTTNLNTPSNVSCVANVVDKAKAEFSSCMELKYAGFIQSGVYKIRINDRFLNVYCDQKTDGGGWIVFQRRKDGSEDFHRTWKEYKRGFGDLEGEFWLGNDNLAELTEDCCHELRVDLGDNNGETKYAKYAEFKVLDEASLYELNIGRFVGNAGDSLRPHNKKKFSTNDSDNDEFKKSCADMWGGGWWFKQCFQAFLNGKYRAAGKVDDNYSRISWIGWKNKGYQYGSFYSLTFTEMKFR